MTVIASVMAISAFCGEYYTRRIIMNEDKEYYNEAKGTGAISSIVFIAIAAVIMAVIAHLLG